MDKEEKFISAYADMIYYNGYEKELSRLYEYVVHAKIKNNILPFPKYLENIDCDLPMRWLWSMLVIMFGSYGTSPRYGWLDMENYNDITGFLQRLTDLVVGGQAND